MSAGTRIVSIKMDLEFHQPVTAYALQIGGWLPLVFVSAPLLLVDRNIVGLVDQIANNSPRGDLTANKWWFEFINSSSVILNPVLCAMEGENQCVPSLAEFREQFNRARATLVRGFPSARVAHFSEEHYATVYEIVRDLEMRHDVEKKFLVKVAPLIAERYGERDLRRVEEFIFDIALDAGIIKCPLVLLAVLSCLYAPRDGSGPKIGRKVLKPTIDYDEVAAHNAISDLRALELLIAANTTGGPEVAFCTRDKYLAAFWCAIQATNPRWDNSNVTFQLRLGVQLFPRLTDEELIELAERLKYRGF